MAEALSRKSLSGYKREKKVDVAKQRLLSVCSEWFETIGSPRALTCWLLLKYGEYAQLVSLKIKPSDYSDVNAFRGDYQATKLLSKYSGFEHEDLDPKKAAVVSYLEAELSCRATNHFFQSEEFRRAVPAWLTRVRERIDRLLGPFKAEYIEDVSFGPGGTIGVSRAEASPYTKMRGLVTVGAQLFDIIKGRGENFAEGLVVKRVAGNELYLVPKNAKTLRSIFKEPTLDAVVQRQIGKAIKERLRRDGCDLRFQSRNQALARNNDRNTDIATIDLKAASDTISYEVVRWLIPLRWFLAMDSVRSPSTIIDGKRSKFEKFSSMGNGYTFELETLIFWCVVKDTIPRDLWDLIAVYGDDIIVPSRYSEVLIERLRFLGFTTNVDKTFTSGPFRESCGSDYFNGNLVTPIYIKDPIRGDKEIVSVCNRIMARADPFGNNGGVYLDPLEDLHKRMVRWLHPGISSNPVPREFGDAGLWGDVRPSNKNVRYNRTLQSWEVKTRIPIAQSLAWCTDENPRVFLMHKLVRGGSVLSIQPRISQTISGRNLWDECPIARDPSDLGEVYQTSNPKLRYVLKWCAVRSLN